MDMEGSDLAALREVPEIHTAVEWKGCRTNDVLETQAVLGIEAAARVLDEEIRDTIAFSGTYVDARHIGTIVNTMARHGKLMPSAARHQSHQQRRWCAVLRGDRRGARTPPSSESATAARPSQSIMLGQRARVGTGRCTVMVDDRAERDSLLGARACNRVRQDEDGRRRARARARAPADTKVDALTVHSKSTRTRV